MREHIVLLVYAYFFFYIYYSIYIFIYKITYKKEGLYFFLLQKRDW